MLAPWGSKSVVTMNMSKRNPASTSKRSALQSGEGGIWAIVVLAVLGLAALGAYSLFTDTSLWNGNVSGSDLTVYPVWCDNANASNLQNCTNPRAGDRMAYKVDSANSQVIFWDPDDAGFGLNKYANCTIVNLNNWSCRNDTYSFGVTSGTYYNNDLIKTIYSSKQQWDNINNGKPSPANVNPPVSTTQSTTGIATSSSTSETTAASATIKQSSLYSTFANPFITGTFSNLSGGIGIFIATQKLPAEILPNATPAGIVFSDGSDHGGGVNLSAAGANASGTYSDTLWQALPNGTYYVGIYEISTIYTSSGFQGYNTAYLLASGMLTVNSSGSN